MTALRLGDLDVGVVAHGDNVITEGLVVCADYGVMVELEAQDFARVISLPDSRLCPSQRSHRSHDR